MMVQVFLFTLLLLSSASMSAAAELSPKQPYMKTIVVILQFPNFDPLPSPAKTSETTTIAPNEATRFW